MRLFILLTFFVFFSYQSYSQIDDYKEVKKLIKDEESLQALDLIDKNIGVHTKDVGQLIDFFFEIQFFEEKKGDKSIFFQNNFFDQYISVFFKIDSLFGHKITSVSSIEILNLIDINNKLWIKALKDSNYELSKERAMQALKIFKIEKRISEKHRPQSTSIIMPSMTSQTQNERILDQQIESNNRMISVAEQINELGSQFSLTNNSKTSGYSDQRIFSLQFENSNLQRERDRARLGMSSEPISRKSYSLDIIIKLNKSAEKNITKNLAFTAELALKNKDTIQALYFNRIVFPSIIIGSKANALLLNNARNEEEHSYYTKSIAARMTEQTIKEIIEFCNLVDQEKLIPIVKIYDDNKEDYPIIKGVLHLFLDNLQEAELNFDKLTKLEKFEPKIYESIGYLYFTYGRKRASQKTLSNDQLKTIFLKSKEYYTIANTPKAKRGIETCNTMLNML